MALFRRLYRLLRLLPHVLHGAWLARNHLPAEPPPRTEAEWRVIRNWSRRVLEIIGVDVEIHGSPARGPVLFVANHVSWMDISAMQSVIDAGFIGKAELRAWPLLGFMIERGGTIFIDRGRHGAAGKTVAEMGRRLARGERVAVFPEGTTTYGDTVRPFHRQLFDAALHAGVPVQPVALVYESPHAPYRDHPLVRHVWRLLGAPRSRLTVTVLPAITAPAGMNRRALALQAWQAISDIVVGSARAHEADGGGGGEYSDKEYGRGHDHGRSRRGIPGQ